MGVLTDLKSDLREFGDRTGSWFDAFIAPLVFVVVNSLAGARPAAGAAIALAVGLVVWRVARRQPIRYAIAGVGGTLFASALAAYSDRGEAYFLPGVVTSAAYSLVFFATVVWGKPAVAWASHWSRRFPKEWYWHPRIRPAYTETTVMWGAFFVVRAGFLGRAVVNEDVVEAATIRILGGWPAIIGLIVVTQIYGRWRLRRLAGPSVREFETGVTPPWLGHAGGF